MIDNAVLYHIMKKIYVFFNENFRSFRSLGFGKHRYKANKFCQAAKQNFPVFNDIQILNAGFCNIKKNVDFVPPFHFFLQNINLSSVID